MNVDDLTRAQAYALRHDLPMPEGNFDRATYGLPTNIRKVQMRSTDSYRTVSEAEYQRRADSLRLEGVDGDEETNTVTYWYIPKFKVEEE